MTMNQTLLFFMTLKVYRLAVIHKISSGSIAVLKQGTAQPAAQADSASAPLRFAQGRSGAAA